MNRRKYFSALGGGLGLILAGCSTGGSGDAGGGEETGRSPPEGDATDGGLGTGGTPTQQIMKERDKSPAETGLKDVRLVAYSGASHVVVESIGFYKENNGTSAGVRGEVWNFTNKYKFSNRYVETVKITVEFYNSAEQIIGRGKTTINGLPPGETATFEIPYRGTADISEIDTYVIFTSNTLSKSGSTSNNGQTTLSESGR